MNRYRSFCVVLACALAVGLSAQPPYDVTVSRQLTAAILEDGRSYQYVSELTETVNNVIAEIRGRERPDEWVILGAHLDSWDFATGAQANGTGVAMVLHDQAVGIDIDEPALADAVLPMPPQLFAAVVSAGTLRQHLDHQVRCAPHLFANDRQAFRGDEQHVWLDDERALPVEHHVDRRDHYLSEPA